MVSDTDTELKYFRENFPYVVSGKVRKSGHEVGDCLKFRTGAIFDHFCTTEFSQLFGHADGQSRIGAIFDRFCTNWVRHF